MTDCPKEHDEQVEVIKWFRSAAYLYELEPEALFAIPNGGLRHPATAKRLVEEGVVAGVADLFLSVPFNGFCGLWVEMKRRRGGTQSAAQKAFAQKMQQRGYKYALCKGAQEAIDAIVEYLRDDTIDQSPT